MDDTNWPDGPPGSRLAEVSRRAFLRRAAAVAGVVAVGGVAVACGGGKDDSVLGSTSADATTGSTAAGSPSTSAATTATTAAGGSAAGAIPAGAELAIAFTYTPSDSGGRVENPYVAVWVEDADEALVEALGVWYQGGPKQRYLSELQRWASVSGSVDNFDAISSATRTPGAYSVVWDGTEVAGGHATAGEYFVCIEAAREHGPYSLIRQSVTLGDAAFETALTDNGELSGASARYRVG